MPIMNMQIKKPGIRPSGTLSITTNGTQDVTTYASVAVQVPKPGPDMYTSYELNSSGTLVKGPSVVAFEPITDVASNCLKDAFYSNSTITGKIDLSSLTTVTGSYGFSNTFSSCTGITSVDMSHLRSITASYACNSMFKNCTHLQTAKLDSLTTVTGNNACQSMFEGCSRLTTFVGADVDLGGITTIGLSSCSRMFYGCSALTGRVDLGSLATISNNGCEYMFANCTRITSVDMSSLEKVRNGNSFYYMFSGCEGLTSLDLSSLTEVNAWQGCAQMFYRCTGLTSVSLPSLKTISGYASMANIFEGCTGIVSADVGNLTTLDYYYCFNDFFKDCTSLVNVDVSSLTSSNNQNMERSFQGCTSLTTLRFSSFTLMTGSNIFSYTFRYCTSLANVYFPCVTPSSFGSRTNQFGNMLTGVTGCTLHFPSNTQAKIESMQGYPNFGGTSTTVLFDQPATNTLTGADSNTYTRNPKYDTGTALAWKIGAYGTTDFTPAYYTNGTTDPVVNSVIYSDSACTTAVTTISSIA